MFCFATQIHNHRDADARVYCIKSWYINWSSSEEEDLATLSNRQNPRHARMKEVKKGRGLYKTPASHRQKAPNEIVLLLRKEKALKGGWKGSWPRG